MDEIYRLFVEKKEEGWRITANVSPKYISKRIWDLSTRMRDFYLERADVYDYGDFDRFANIPLDREWDIK